MVAKKGIYKEEKKELKDLEVKYMDEKKYVTIEMFEQYHKKLMEYIGLIDDSIINDETICPKCGATITSDKCEKCVVDKGGIKE